jgi:hypothetical protein
MFLNALVQVYHHGQELTFSNVEYGESYFSDPTRPGELLTARLWVSLGLSAAEFDRLRQDRETLGPESQDLIIVRRLRCIFLSKPQPVQVYRGKLWITYLAERTVEVVPEDLHFAEVVGWEKALYLDAETAATYADWCEQMGWFRRAEQMRGSDALRRLAPRIPAAAQSIDSN